MHCLPGSRKTRKSKRRRARDEALKEARDKARVEEEERQAVRDKCDKRRRQDMQFEQFLDYTNEKSVRHIQGNFSFHFLTHFFLCMYTVIMIIHTPKLYTHPRYSLLIFYVLAQARPTMTYIH